MSRPAGASSAAVPTEGGKARRGPGRAATLHRRAEQASPGPREETKVRIGFVFAWYDLYIGAYWDREKRRLYIFPVPMLGIVLYFGHRSRP